MFSVPMISAVVYLIAWAYLESVTTTIGRTQTTLNNRDLVFAGQQPTKASAYKVVFPHQQIPSPSKCGFQTVPISTAPAARLFDGRKQSVHVNGQFNPHGGVALLDGRLDSQISILQLDDAPIQHLDIVFGRA
jgi:hypothetical protein